MAIVTDIPWKKKDGTPRLGFYMDRWLKDNLDGIPFFISKKYDVVGIVSGTSKVRLGKMNINGTKVLMADGTWKKIEDTKVGDKIISPSKDGRSSTVATIVEYEDHKNVEICEVRKSRDNSLLYECCVDHHVPVKTLWIKTFKDKPTEYIWKDEIYQAGQLADKNETWIKNHCPKTITSPVITKFEADDFEVDPYFLGLFLGDGNIASKNRVRITNPDKNIFQWLNNKMGARKINEKSCPTISIEFDSSKLKCPTGSYNKKIPEEVFSSSYEYRKRVFEGLLDTDAYVDPNGYVIYSTASEQLAIDVRKLVKTLGCRACIKLIYKNCQSFKEKRKYYLVNINVGPLCKNLNLLREERKKRILRIDLNNEQNKESQYDKIYVKKISERKDGRCIQVDSDSHLYITDDYCVNHNSTLAMQVGYYIAWILAGGRTILDDNGNRVDCIPPDQEVRFGLDHIVFSPDDLKKKAHELPPNSVIVYDEGRAGLDSSRSMESVNKGMQDFFQECGVFGHVILIVLPDFFQLHQNFAVSRSLFLINVFTNDVFERGYFSFYNEQQKELLYFWGKKKIGASFRYRAAKRNFWGTFSDWLPFDKDEYENKKKQALAAKSIGRKQIQEMKERDLLIHYIVMKLGIKKMQLEKDMEKFGYNNEAIRFSPHKIDKALRNIERLWAGADYVPDGTDENEESRIELQEFVLAKLRARQECKKKGLPPPPVMDKEYWLIKFGCLKDDKAKEKEKKELEYEEIENTDDDLSSETEELLENKKEPDLSNEIPKEYIGEGVMPEEIPQKVPQLGEKFELPSD